MTTRANETPSRKVVFWCKVLPSKTPQCYLVQASVQNTIPAPMNQFFNGTRVHDSVSFRSGKNSKLPVFRGKGSTIVVGRTPHPRRVASQTRWGGRRARKRDFLIHGFLTCVYHFLEDFKKEPKKRNPPGRFGGVHVHVHVFVALLRGSRTVWNFFLVFVICGGSFSAVCTPLLARVDVFYWNFVRVNWNLRKNLVFLKFEQICKIS